MKESKKKGELGILTLFCPLRQPAGCLLLLWLLPVEKVNRQEMCGTFRVYSRHEETSGIVKVVQEKHPQEKRREWFILRTEGGLWCHRIKMF